MAQSSAVATIAVGGPFFALFAQGARAAAKSPPDWATPVRRIGCLEDQLERELNVTGIAGIENAAKRTTGPAGAHADNRCTLSQVRMIQRVEELGAELRAEALTNLRVLEDRCVPSFV